MIIFFVVLRRTELALLLIELNIEKLFMGC